VANELDYLRDELAVHVSVDRARLGAIVRLIIALRLRFGGNSVHGVRSGGRLRAKAGARGKVSSSSLVSACVLS
jgi:hypothetical protein